MVLLHVTCSVCSRAFGARRLDHRGNYCSASCKAKAYRARKAQAQLAKDGTYDMDTYHAVQKLQLRYGQDISDIPMDILSQYGANALKMALLLVHACLKREAELMELGVVS